MAQERITLAISAVDADLQKVLRRTKVSLDKMATSAEKSTRRTTKAFKGLDKQAAGSVERVRAAVLNLRYAFLTLGGGAVLGSITKFAATFETALSEVGTLLDENAIKLDVYERQLIRMSRGSSKDLIDLTKGLYQVISAGIPQVEGAGGAMDLLNQAQKAATAGVTDTKVAVDALVTVVNSYGASVVSPTKASDVLFQTVKLGRTTFRELGKAIGRVAPIAAKFGVNIEDLSAMLVQLTRNGLNTNEAVTALRNMIRSLAKPSKQSRELLAALAKETKNSSLEMTAMSLRTKGLSGTLKDLSDATGGNVDVLARLFPNIRAMLPAVVSIGTGFDEFKDILGLVNENTGATSRALQEFQGDTEYTYKLVKNNLNASLIELGEGVLPILIERLQQFDGFLRANQKSLIAFGQAAVDVFDGIATALIAVGKIFAGTPFLKEVLIGGLLVKVIRGLTTAIVAMTIGATANLGKVGTSFALASTAITRSMASATSAVTGFAQASAIPTVKQALPLSGQASGAGVAGQTIGSTMVTGMMGRLKGAGPAIAGAIRTAASSAARMIPQLAILYIIGSMIGKAIVDGVFKIIRLARGETIEELERLRKDAEAAVSAEAQDTAKAFGFKDPEGMKAGSTAVAAGRMVKINRNLLVLAGRLANKSGERLQLAQELNRVEMSREQVQRRLQTALSEQNSTMETFLQLQEIALGGYISDQETVLNLYKKEVDALTLRGVKEKQAGDQAFKSVKKLVEAELLRVDGAIWLADAAERQYDDAVRLGNQMMTNLENEIELLKESQLYKNQNALILEDVIRLEAKHTQEGAALKQTLRELKAERDKRKAAADALRDQLKDLETRRARAKLRDEQARKAGRALKSHTSKADLLRQIESKLLQFARDRLRVMKQMNKLAGVFLGIKQKIAASDVKEAEAGELHTGRRFNAAEEAEADANEMSRAGSFALFGIKTPPKHEFDIDSGEYHSDLVKALEAEHRVRLDVYNLAVKTAGVEKKGQDDVAAAKQKASMATVEQRPGVLKKNATAAQRTQIREGSTKLLSEELAKNVEKEKADIAKAADALESYLEGVYEKLARANEEARLAAIEDQDDWDLDVNDILETQLEKASRLLTGNNRTWNQWAKDVGGATNAAAKHLTGFAEQSGLVSKEVTAFVVDFDAIADGAKEGTLKAVKQIEYTREAISGDWLTQLANRWNNAALSLSDYTEASGKGNKRTQTMRHGLTNLAGGLEQVGISIKPVIALFAGLSKSFSGAAWKSAGINLLRFVGGTFKILLPQIRGMRDASLGLSKDLALAGTKSLKIITKEVSSSGILLGEGAGKAFKGLTKHMSGITSKFVSIAFTKPLKDLTKMGIQALKPLGKAFGKLVGAEGVLGKMGGVLGEAVGDIVDSISPLLELPSMVLGQVTDKIVMPAFNAASAGIGKFFGAFQESMSAMLDFASSKAAFAEERRGLRETHQQEMQNLVLTGGSVDQLSASVNAHQDAINELRQREIEASPMNVLTKTVGEALQVVDTISQQLPLLVETFITMTINNVPKIIQKLATTLAEIIPIIAASLPELVESLLTALLDALPKLVNALLMAIPDILDALINGIALVIERLPELVEQFLNSLIEMLPILFERLAESIPRLITAIIIAIPKILIKIVKLLPKLIEAVVAGIPKIIGGIIEAIPDIIGGLIKAVPKLIGAIIVAIPRIVWSLISGLGKGLKRIFRSIGRMFNPSNWFHDGGMVRQSHGTGQSANLGMFRSMGAQTYALGGVVGAAAGRAMADNIPAILQAGEAVLSRKGVAALGGESGVAAANAGKTPSDFVSGTPSEGMVVNVNIGSDDEGMGNVAAALLPSLLGNVTASIVSPMGAIRGALDSTQKTLGLKPVKGRE